MYENQAEKAQYEAVIKDFKDFLDFITYEFYVDEDVKPDEGPEISKSEMRKIVKEAEKKPLNQLKKKVLLVKLMTVVKLKN